MTPDIPAPPEVPIPDARELGPDPEPLGLRAERLLQRCEPRRPLPARIPNSRTRSYDRSNTRRPHVGAQRGRHR